MSLLGSGPESLAWLGVEYASLRMWRVGFFLDLEKVYRNPSDSYVWTCFVSISLVRDEVFVVSLDRQDLSWDYSLQLALESEQTYKA